VKLGFSPPFFIPRLARQPDSEEGKSTGHNGSCHSLAAARIAQKTSGTRERRSFSPTKSARRLPAPAGGVPAESRVLFSAADSRSVPRGSWIAPSCSARFASTLNFGRLHLRATLARSRNSGMKGTPRAFSMLDGGTLCSMRSSCSTRGCYVLFALPRRKIVRWRTGITGTKRTPSVRSL